MRGWYILHTLSGQEKRLAEAIRKKIEEGELKGIVYDVKVPVEQIVEMKDGKKIKKERKFFPGYILVDMEMSWENMRKVRKLPGATYFLSTAPNKLPVPLKEKEIKAILDKEKEMEKAETPGGGKTITIDEVVKIIDGPFKGFQGVVEDINPEKGRVRVRVEIFGRATPVDLDFLQIEKII